MIVARWFFLSSVLLFGTTMCASMSHYVVGRGVVTEFDYEARSTAGVSSMSFESGELPTTSSVGAQTKTLFHLQESIDIYGSATLSAGGNRLLLSQATNYNADSKLNIIDLLGVHPTGVPVWTLVDDQMVAVRPDHNLATAEFAALSTNFVINGSKVYEYNRVYANLDSRANALPHQFINYSLPGSDSAFAGGALSSDGKVFVAAVNTQVGCKIELFQPLTPGAKPKSIDLQSMGYCGPPSANVDGRVVMVKVANSQSENVVIIDGIKGKVSHQFKNQIAGQFVCLSNDGTLLATGFQQIQVLHYDWHTARLTPVYSSNAPNNFYLNLCEFDRENNVAMQFTAFSFETNRIELFNVDKKTYNLTSRWTFSPPKANSTLQDTPVALSFDQHNGVLLMTSWGTSQQKVPTVTLLNAHTGHLVWSFSTPGSMFGGDVAELSKGVYRVTCAGKHVHANIMGDGGDAYAFDVTL